MGRLRALAPLTALAVLGCSAGESPQSGLAAEMRVQGGQFVEGALTQEPLAEMPVVRTVLSNNNRLYPGVMNKSLSGSVGPGSFAVHLGLVGDAGHWVVPVGDLDQNNPGDYTFSARLSFSPSLPAGPVNVILRAAGRDGRLGPPQMQTFTLAQVADLRPLAFTLTWDSETDLDLRVLAPGQKGGAAVEIGPDKATNLNPPPPGDPPLSEADLASAGRLDSDSNGQCVIDGRRSETVAWTVTPPVGHYEVRVDTFSLCGESTARWRLQIWSNGQLLDDRTGQSTEFDTRYAHGRGAGVLVSAFEVNR